uniref:Uncharacterized protein n=1 Tax=Candidatus Kentrum sp. LPFa TaxID=2126335 RepID=A0A450XIU7_9GAMM|nr:MAG: hypothetical protein BECKLPF1236A_GA0070988_100789 [Candidatus Kentron sp. LPFa]VFK29240.1 MAG: hypothetical protein BECKLPF1236C_GA0070990_100832 [Candidatus Kentron sp. LPFa]
MVVTIAPGNAIPDKAYCLAVGSVATDEKLPLASKLQLGGKRSRINIIRAEMNVYFTDYFQISKDVLADYGAFNISLINDLPVFIDPFLLFNSEKDEYVRFHEEIIRYIRFLKEMSEADEVSKKDLRNFFTFKEVKQNWLGYSLTGNSGSGLGSQFANAVKDDLAAIFQNFGNEEITYRSHLEKLSLIRDGVGRDNISDLTTNLIKGFLAEYTQAFAERHIDDAGAREVMVKRAEFDYEMRRWIDRKYRLPYTNGDYVLLTPRDILTKDEMWINKQGIFADFDGIRAAISNHDLRAEINEYFLRQIPRDATRKEKETAKKQTLKQYPQLIDYYIRDKEDHGQTAVSISQARVKDTEEVFIAQVSQLIDRLEEESEFYAVPADTLDAAHMRVQDLKKIIESNDGYRIFHEKGKPVKRGDNLYRIFRLAWFASPEGVDAKAGNGPGPINNEILRDPRKSALVFKLASNPKLEQYFKDQADMPNQSKKSIIVILYFSDVELEKILEIFTKLKLQEGKSLVLIDASATDK